MEMQRWWLGRGWVGAGWRPMPREHISPPRGYEWTDLWSLNPPEWEYSAGQPEKRLCVGGRRILPVQKDGGATSLGIALSVGASANLSLRRGSQRGGSAIRSDTSRTRALHLSARASRRPVQGPPYSTVFHALKKKSDMVRRRAWRRHYAPPNGTEATARDQLVRPERPEQKERTADLTLAQRGDSEDERPLVVDSKVMSKEVRRSLRAPRLHQTSPSVPTSIVLPRLLIDRLQIPVWHDAATTARRFRVAPARRLGGRSG